MKLLPLLLLTSLPAAALDGDAAFRATVAQAAATATSGAAAFSAVRAERAVIVERIFALRDRMHTASVEREELLARKPARLRGLKTLAPMSQLADDQIEAAAVAYTRADGHWLRLSPELQALVQELQTWEHQDLRAFGDLLEKVAKLDAELARLESELKAAERMLASAGDRKK